MVGPAELDLTSIPPTPIHTAADDHGVAYGTWAGVVGTYKCSFHGDMTFVPYLGSEYPHNQPFSWRTSSITIGHTSLLAAEPIPQRWHDDYRYEYRLGAVTEAYDVRRDGLEQTFVVYQRPAAGDLVITGTVTSLLSTANVPAAHQELTFYDDAGASIVRYGKAFAFDAVGAQVPVTTAFQNGQITLTVPASWLARAALPVTVDPLLTRQQIGTWSGSELRSVDIARDDNADQLLFVTVAAASQFDEDVAATICDDDYTPLGGVFSDVTSSWDSDGASCAYVGGADKWAIVFRRYFASSPIRTSRLRCHVRASGNLTWSTTVGFMAGTAGFNDWRPDVGGVESFAAGNQALVVFQRENNSNTAGHWLSTSTTDVRGLLLDVTSLNGTFGTDFTIAIGPADFERPSVNKVAEGGATFSWLCAFQATNHAVGGSWNVRARRVASSGVPSGVAWASTNSAANTHHQLGPQVDGASGRYAIAYTQTDIATTAINAVINGKELYVERVNWMNSSNVPSGGYPPVNLETDTSKIFEATGMAYDTRDESHWVISYRTIAPSNPSARCIRVGYHGMQTEGPQVLYSSSPHKPTGVACVFDNDDVSFRCGYGVVRASSTDPIYGHTFTYVSAPAATLTGTSCQPVSLSWLGNQQIGSEFNQIRSFNATSTSGHLMFVSLGTANVPIVHPIVLPGCHLLIDTGSGLLGSMSFQVGANATWQLPLPEPLQPVTLYFQDWILDGATLTSSGRLSVPLVK